MSILILLKLMDLSTYAFFFYFLRVRLVERGSPHSLPLMESGKVRVRAIFFPHYPSVGGELLL